MHLPKLPPTVLDTAVSTQANNTQRLTATATTQNYRKENEPVIVHATGRNPPQSLRNLPTEIFRSIAVQLPVEDRFALALARSSAIYPHIKMEARAAFQAISLAPKVTTLARFKTLLSQINSLPKHLQGDPLHALGIRLRHFPAAKQQKAIDLFLESTKSYPEVRATFIATTLAPRIGTLAEFTALLPLIKSLPPSLQNGPLGMWAARIAYLPPAEKQQAIDTLLREGAEYEPDFNPVRDPIWEASKYDPDNCLFHEFFVLATTRPAHLGIDEEHRKEMARSHISSAHATVQAAMQKCGVTNPEAILALDDDAVFIRGFREIEGGKDLFLVIHRLGISSSKSIANLTRAAARYAIKKCRNNVQEVIERYEITEQRDIDCLEYDAFNIISKAIDNGEDVEVLIPELGISNADNIATLRAQAAARQSNSGSRNG